MVPKRKRIMTGVATAATSSCLVLRAVPAMYRSVCIVPTASLLGDFTPPTPHWLCGNTTYGLWRPHDRYRITVSSIRSWSQTHQYGGHNCDSRDRDRKVPWNQTFLATHDRLRRTGNYHRTDNCWRTGSERDERYERKPRDTESSASPQIAASDENIGQYNGGNKE